MKGAIYTVRSKNRKIGPADSTYASIKATCPTSCALKDNGCYAQSSFTGIINARLNRRARQFSPLQVARAEAQAIDQAYGGRPIPKHRDMRIHTIGDSRSIKGTRLINSAIGRWKKRGGGVPWSYTHAWKHVPRKVWSNVSILASIESVKQVAEARQQGYAPAIVVASFPSEKMFRLEGSDVKWIPCPAQLKETINCVTCRLCFKSDWLFETNRGIAFSAHGAGKQLVKRHLTVIQ